MFHAMINDRHCNLKFNVFGYVINAINKTCLVVIQILTHNINF